MWRPLWKWTSVPFWFKLTVLLIPVLTTMKTVRGGWACLENPCFHGICIDYLDINRNGTLFPHEDEDESEFTCYCRNGFTGYSCEINWDECRFNPCLNNGICNDGIATFNCSCPENFAGSLCQYDLSACDEIFPCQNNGTCTIDYSSGNETLSCSCLPGFLGPQCQLDVSVCNTTENVCLNGGLCVDGVGDNFHCKCEPGWGGKICAEQIDNCVSQPCQNGGICVNRLNDFGCACPFGYTGKACEKKLKICEVNPCQNGAFCLHEHEDDSKHTCYCVPDYHGELCEFKYDDCSPLPKCHNGGTCIDGVGDFLCQCPPPFFGKRCQCTVDNMTDPGCHYNETNFLTSTEIYQYSTTVSSLIFELSTKYSEQSELMSSISEETLISLFSSLPPTLTHGSEESSTFDFESNVIVPTSSMSDSEESSTLPIISDQPFTITTNIIPPQSSSISLEGSEMSASPSFLSSLFSTPTLTTSLSGPDLTTETMMSISEGDIMSTGVVSSFDFHSIIHGDLTAASEVLLSSSVKGVVESSESQLPTSKPMDQVGVTSPHSDSQMSATATISGILPSSIATVITSIQSVLFTTTLPPSDIISTEVVASEPTISYDFSTVDMESAYHSDHSIHSSLSTDFPHISVFPTTTHQFPFTSAFGSDTISEQQSSSPSIMISSEITEDSSFQYLASTPTTSLPPPVSSTSINPSESDKIQNISLPTPTISPSSIGTASSQLPTPEESLSDIVFETSSEVSWSLSSFIQPSITLTEDNIMSTSALPDPSTSSSLYITTPESPLSSPTVPTITTNDTQDDLCHNFCLNNGKCFSDSIEPFCICSFKFTGKNCESPRKRFKTVSFTGDSFLEYKVPNDSLNSINVKTTLATNAPDAILFYTSSFVGRLYALIFIQGGHITLHFSCGVQSMHFVETRTRVDNGYNFTLEFNMEMNINVMNESEVHCIGQVSVNHSYIMRGEQIVGHNELYDNPIQSVYLGGVDTTENNSRKSDDLIRIMPGFRGCLYNLWINGQMKDLFEEAIDGRGVAECSAFGCLKNPCFGGSKCVSSNIFPFWQCICSHGFKGARCQDRVCDSNPCQNGATCTFLVEEFNSVSNSTEITTHHPKPFCLCPLGYTGSLCQSTLNVTKSSFKPFSGFDYSAFIAYEPIPRFADWVQFKLHFVVHNTSQISLILYSGYTQSLTTPGVSNPDELNALTELLQEDSTIRDVELAKTNSNEVGALKVSDFFSITYVHGYIALTWNLGSGTQRIITPSRIDKRLNVHTLFAGRHNRQAWLKVDGMKNITGKSPGPFHRLNVNTELFLGGYDAFRFEGLPHDLPMHEGFFGCIFDFGFRIQNKMYLPRARRGRNVKNCYEEDC